MWLQDKGRLTAKAQKMWITANDERVCPVCGPLHGQKVLVSEQFHTKEGSFWTPGLHPNCRCTVRLLENTFAKSWEEKQHPRGEHGKFSRVSQQPYQITEDDQEHYVNERCNDLALVIHQRTGWPVWGVFTTNSDDEREEAWWHTGVLTPDGQWLDVRGKKPLAEVQDEWSEYLYEEGDVDLEPVQDFGKDDGSEVTPRAKKIADALLAEHEIKKDDWEPKLHPRGGDPENRGRFSRLPKVLEKEREKPVIAVPSILDDLKPETQTETEPETFKLRGDTEESFKLGGEGGAFSLSGKPFSLGEKKFSLAEQKFELGGEEKFELEQGKTFSLSREEIAAKIKLAPEIKLKMIAETEKFLIGDVTEYVKPKVEPNKLYHKPVIGARCQRQAASVLRGGGGRHPDRRVHVRPAPRHRLHSEPGLGGSAGGGGSRGQDHRWRRVDLPQPGSGPPLPAR